MNGESVNMTLLQLDNYLPVMYSIVNDGASINHGRTMDDPWTTGFYSSGAALASRFIAQALRG